MDPEQDRIAPRQSLTALLFSAFLPGLGQLYNGEVSKAAWFFILTLCMGIPLASYLILHLPAAWTLYIVVGIVLGLVLLWLLGMVDAVLSARRKQVYKPLAWQGMGTYVLVFLLLSQVLYPSVNTYLRSYWLEGFTIPSASMEPTLIAGDWILATQRYNCAGCVAKVKRGDVVVFTYPYDRTINYIKRVIGLPGDRIQIRGMQVSVNGETISSAPKRQSGLAVVQERYEDKRWVVVWREPDKVLRPLDVTVGAGEVFVLGDNRNNSNDSRALGAIPLHDVFAKARQIWMSYSRERGGLQWDRIGQVVD